MRVCNYCKKEIKFGPNYIEITSHKIFTIQHFLYCSFKCMQNDLLKITIILENNKQIVKIKNEKNI